jgi:hypothetical protein
MNFKRISAVINALAILASLTFPVTAQVQNSSEQYIRFDTPPKLCVGDTWTYFGNEFIATVPWTATVQSVDKGVATILRQGAPEVGQKRERIEIRLANGNYSKLGDTAFSPDGQDFAFPLVVGKTWEIKQTYNLESGAIMTKTGTAEVKGREQVQTKAGSFDTIRLQQYGNLRNSQIREFNASYQYTYWYAPAAKTIVKVDYGQNNNGPRGGSLNRVSEVTAFKVGNCD